MGNGDRGVDKMISIVLTDLLVKRLQSVSEDYSTLACDSDTCRGLDISVAHICTLFVVENTMLVQSEEPLLETNFLTPLMTSWCFGQVTGDKHVAHI